MWLTHCWCAVCVLYSCLVLSLSRGESGVYAVCFLNALEAESVRLHLLASLMLLVLQAANADCLCVLGT